MSHHDCYYYYYYCCFFIIDTGIVFQIIVCIRIIITILDSEDTAWIMPSASFEGSWVRTRFGAWRMYYGAQ